MDKYNIIDEIIISVKNETFFDKIKEIYISEVRSNKKNLTTHLIELHNDGRINLNKLYQSLPPETTSDNAYIFFNLYSQLIPNILCSVIEVFSTLQEIEKNGFEFIDIHEGIFKLLCLDEKHPIEAMKLSQRDDCLIPFISSIIVSAYFYNPAWCLEQINKHAKSNNVRLRAQSYNAIGRISLSENKHIEFILRIILRSTLNEFESIPKINLLNGLINFGKRHEGIWDRLEGCLHNLIQAPDKNLTDQITILAHIEYNKIPFSFTSCFIDIIKKDEWNLKTKIGFELLLIDLAKDKKEKIAIELIEMKSQGQFSLNQLESLWHYIKTENNSLINKLITKWLLSGRPELCRQLEKTLNQDGDKKIRTIIDDTIISSISDDQYLFLAKKSIGWLFTKPIHLFCFLCSIYKKSPEKIKPSILSLIFDPLLISYPNELGEYLDLFPDNPDIRISRKLKDMLEEYFHALNMASENHEIKTPYRNKELQWANSNKLINKAKEDGPKSIFHDAFPVSHLLYGNSSLHYVYSDPNENHKLNESSMYTFSYSSEIPNLEIIDPLGLNRCLLSFRMEKI